MLAGERERRTWDALLLTGLGVRNIVRAKFLSSLALCFAVLIFFLPFLLTFLYKIQIENGLAFVVDIMPGDKPLLDEWPPSFPVATIYLFWLTVRLFGHILTFLSLGMAISAYCNRIKTALTTTILLVAGGNFALFCFDVRDSIWMEEKPIYWALGWPLLLVEYIRSSTDFWLHNRHWLNDLLSDALWIGILPWFFYRLALRGSRRAG